MKKPSIYKIKASTAATAPYFFDRKTLKFFGQTMRDFKVLATSFSGIYKVMAPMYSCGKPAGDTVRYFNTATNELISEYQFATLK